MSNKFKFGKYYINSQFVLMNNWSGFGVTFHWIDSEIARDLTFNFMFFNISISLNFGFNKVVNYE